MTSDPSLDLSLDLPARIAPLDRLEGPGDALCVASPARPRPFLLLARGCSARGVETRGIDGVEMEGRSAIRGLRIAGATCGNVLLAPAHARRELLTRAGTISEVLLVTGEGFLARWTPAGGDPGPVRIQLRLDGERWRAEGALLRVDGGDGVRVLAVDPAPEWSIRPERGELVVSASLPAGSSASLRAAVADDGAVAWARIGRLGAARAVQAESAAAALRTRRLAMRTGAAEIDDALAWALARADAVGPREDVVHELAVGEAFPLDPDARRAWCALGQLASDGDPIAPAPSDPLALLVAARAAEWRGGPLAKAARAAVDALADDGAATGAAAVARRAALLACADVIEPADKPRAEALRARAAASPSFPTPPAPAPLGPGRRLPTVGSAGASSAPGGTASLASVLAAALDLPGRASAIALAEDPAPGALRALTALALLNDGQLERGQALLRQHLADGFSEGVGMWPDGGRIHDPTAAALVPVIVLEGLLGARIDAHHGRLRLAPRLPASWTRFAVEHVRIGVARVGLRYERADGVHRFRIAQESGAMPIMLIFEPVVAAPERPRTWVDGQPAELTVARVGGFAQARVQLPLDAEREVSIEAG